MKNDNLYIQNDTGFDPQSWIGEPNVTFADNDGKVIGKLTWPNGKFEFEGETEQSAKLFFDLLLEYWENHETR